MAQHGYLHDTYDRDDFGRGSDRDDRERSWRDRDDERNWRGRDEERGWRGYDERQSGWGERDHDRGSMFGWADPDRQSSHRHSHHGGDDRGFFERAGDEMGSWFGGDDHGREARRSQGDRWQNRGQQGSGSWQQGGEGYSAHPDDHYRSWRDKQMQALDRDYQDYCREREHQFHSEFDSWRQNRRNQGLGHGQQSMSERDSQTSGQSGSAGETMELNNPARQGGDVSGATTSPMGAATLGTNNSENTASAPSATGRTRR